MRKFVNDPRAAMREMLEGIADLSPNLALLAEAGVIARADIPTDPALRDVAILSGGGSGHEPAHAGYVGAGMLHAAVAGDVFTSPSVDAVLDGIRAVAGPAGAVLIVKNYTGDRLNFGLAAELARAEGIPCESVVVADDVALRDTVPHDRRRGIAGTVLIHKIAGAAAAAGLPLHAIAERARLAASQLATMGVALGACTVPAAGRPGFDLADDEMELGLGIHGEAGVLRAPRAPADAIVARILATIQDEERLVSGDRVALLVNGLGGTPPMELAILARHALAVLRGAGLVVERAWCGSFLTALEMPGCSLSVLRVDEERLAALDAPSSAPAWPGPGLIPAARALIHAPARHAEDTGTHVPDARLRAVAHAVAAALDEAEADLTTLDTATGDGDLGLSLARGAVAIRGLPDSAWVDPATALTRMAGVLRHAIAGSSGPFYATALLRAASVLPYQEPVGPADWVAALRAAVAAVGELGGAAPGDRTMLDAMHPAAEAFATALERGLAPSAAWAEAVVAAEAGAEATRTMHPRFGRASYLGERAVGHVDAGAAAVVVWLRAIVPRAA